HSHTHTHTHTHKHTHTHTHPHTRTHHTTHTNTQPHRHEAPHTRRHAHAQLANTTAHTDTGMVCQRRVGGCECGGVEGTGKENSCLRRTVEAGPVQSRLGTDVRA